MPFLLLPKFYPKIHFHLNFLLNFISSPMYLLSISFSDSNICNFSTFKCSLCLHTYNLAFSALDNKFILLRTSLSLSISLSLSLSTYNLAFSAMDSNFSSSTCLRPPACNSSIKACCLSSCRESSSGLAKNSNTCNIPTGLRKLYIINSAGTAIQTYKCRSISTYPCIYIFCH